MESDLKLTCIYTYTLTILFTDIPLGNRIIQKRMGILATGNNFKKLLDRYSICLALSESKKLDQNILSHPLISLSCVLTLPYCYFVAVKKKNTYQTNK